MDVGSVPKPPTINDLYHFLEQHPEVGAATGSFLMPIPQKPWHLASLWQFGDQYFEKLLLRSAESLTGYLSVLSGRFSIFRWATIKVDVNNKGIAVQPVSPLDRYFQGMNPNLGIFEANMFFDRRSNHLL